jgi:3alpha(or 20beta)-hydroxysteroid dehydrogenase
MSSASVRFEGQVALVTGAAQGIGAATARGFAAGGGRVVLADVRAQAVASLAAELGDAASDAVLDVTDPSAWEAAVAKAQAQFGGLTHLFNVAGISTAANIEQATPEHWDSILAVNLTGPFLGCRTAIPAMVASGDEACAIINVGSMLALRPSADFPAYSASKAGLTALTKSVALHCARQGYPIRVNAVHPGAIQTPMVDDVLDGMTGDRAANAKRFAEKLPLQRLGQAEEVARSVLFLASREASFITAADLPVDGGGANRE